MKNAIINFKNGNRETVQFFIKRYLSSYHKFDNLFTNDIKQIKNKIKEIRLNNIDIKIKIVIGSIHKEDKKRLKRLNF